MKVLEVQTINWKQLHSFFAWRRGMGSEEVSSEMALTKACLDLNCEQAVNKHFPSPVTGIYKFPGLPFPSLQAPLSLVSLEADIVERPWRSEVCRPGSQGF